jgi:hypothetical protein
MEEEQTGIELIAQERKEQIEKHGRTIDNDAFYNNDGQLRQAAASLMGQRQTNEDPDGWDTAIWVRMLKKPLKERLIIAGALIAAEIDRLNYKNL